MSRFHVNPETGNVRACGAVYECPFGEANHYDSPEEARESYEISMAAKRFGGLQRGSLRDEKLIDGFSIGEVEIDGMKFIRDPYSYDTAYYQGTSSNLGGNHVAYFGHDDKKSWLVADFGKENRTLHEVKFGAQDYDGSGSVTSEALASSLESSMAVAKREIPEIFDTESKAHSRLKEIFDGLQNYRVELDGVKLDRTGWGAPDVWEAPFTDRPGFKEIYVRSRHGLATAYLVQNNNERIAIAQESHTDGNWDTVSQALFFAKVNDSFMTKTL